MSNPITIFCTNTGSNIEIEGGATLRSLLPALVPQLGFTPLCARVNFKTEGLQYPVYSPKTVEFVRPSTATSDRVYIRSLCMMLYKAVDDVLGSDRVALRIAHSVAGGNYCTLTSRDNPGRTIAPDEVLTGSLLRRMRRLVEEDIPFERHERPTSEVIEIFERQHLDDKVRLLKSIHELYTVYYSLGSLSDSYYSVLADSTGCVPVFDLVPYKQGMLLLGPDRQSPERPRSPLTQEKMFKAFTEYIDFNRIIGVSDAGQLNTAVAEGRSANIVDVAEALHNQSMASIADTIADRYSRGGAHIVLIAGPSSSGKTTFTKRLAIQLMTHLLEPRMISLDNYFVDRHHTPLDEHGDYDYESLYALDLDTFNDHLNRLLAGHTVSMPTYNFESGTREYRPGNTLTLNDRSILLIEGIHGLNPELTANIPADQKFTIYVSALTTIAIDDHNWVPTTDNRLLRRIIRDAKYRGVDAAETIRRWPSVRRGEERWIFPFQENADAMFNSSLLFELGVMKERGERLLLNVPRDCPQYGEAYRLRKFLSYFSPISEANIPSTSLLREFLGGSSFHY